MSEPKLEAQILHPSEVEIILEEQPSGDGFRITMQPHRLDGGKLVATGPRCETWRPASEREREEQNRTES